MKNGRGDDTSSSPHPLKIRQCSLNLAQYQDQIVTVQIDIAQDQVIGIQIRVDGMLDRPTPRYRRTESLHNPAITAHIRQLEPSTHRLRREPVLRARVARAESEHQLISVAAYLDSLDLQVVRAAGGPALKLRE